MHPRPAFWESFFFSLSLFMSLSSPSFLHRPTQKHILLVFYLLPHSSTFCSTAVNICGTAPFNTSFLSRPLFRTFISSFLLYVSDLILSWFRKFSASLDAFPRGESSFLTLFLKSHPTVLRAEQDVNLLLQLGMFKETFAHLNQIFFLNLFPFCIFLKNDPNDRKNSCSNVPKHIDF